jgi:hypothetical protein
MPGRPKKNLPPESDPGLHDPPRFMKCAAFFSGKVKVAGRIY